MKPTHARDEDAPNWTICGMGTCGAAIVFENVVPTCPICAAASVVANKKTARPHPHDVYIGRPSPFGNPYETGTREENIAQFTTYFHERIRAEAEFRDAVLALRGRRLICWCKPLACHGDVIAAWLRNPVTDIPNLPPLIAQNRFAVIDTETTGLSTKSDEAVQIALACIDHGRPLWRHYIKLRPAVPIKEAAARVHGITADQVQFSPTFDKIARELFLLLDDRVLVGYGIARFDFPILRRQFDDAGVGPFKPKIVDVLLWERKFAKETPGHSLTEAANRWGVTVPGRHDAWADCRMTWNIFLELAARFPALGDADLETVLVEIKS